MSFNRLQIGSDTYHCSYHTMDSFIPCDPLLPVPQMYLLRQTLPHTGRGESRTSIVRERGGAGWFCRLHGRSIMLLNAAGLSCNFPCCPSRKIFDMDHFDIRIDVCAVRHDFGQRDRMHQLQKDGLPNESGKETGHSMKYKILEERNVGVSKGW